VRQTILKRFWWGSLASVLIVFLTGCDAGSLEAGSEPGSEVSIGFVIDRENQKSTGFHVCTTGSEVELVEVEPIEIVGEAEFLGAYLLTEGEAPIGSANGFPPEGYDQYLEPIGEAVVSLACGAPPDEFAHLVVGADWSGDSGGQLNGFRVRYVTDGSTRSLEVPNFHMEMCGANGEYCDD
jgi:hypothetical protein